MVTSSDFSSAICFGSLLETAYWAGGTSDVLFFFSALPMQDALQNILLPQHALLFDFDSPQLLFLDLSTTCSY